MQQRASESIGALAAPSPKRRSSWSIQKSRSLPPFVRMGGTGESRPFVMHRSAPDSRSHEKFSGSTRLRPCRRPRLIKPPGLSISPPCSRIHRENGSPLIGQYARLAKPIRRVEWERR